MDLYKGKNLNTFYFEGFNEILINFLKASVTTKEFVNAFLILPKHCHISNAWTRQF